jgi:hypothetical protein
VSGSKQVAATTGKTNLHKADAHKTSLRMLDPPDVRAELEVSFARRVAGSLTVFRAAR